MVKHWFILVSLLLLGANSLKFKCEKLQLARENLGEGAIKFSWLAEGACHFTSCLGFSLGKTFSLSLNNLSAMYLMIRDFAVFKIHGDTLLDISGNHLLFGSQRVTWSFSLNSSICKLLAFRTLLLQHELLMSKRSECCWSHPGPGV